ncbi:MAG: hypothetical protein WCV84_00235 [Patescibacteria group bacterium]
MFGPFEKQIARDVQLGVMDQQSAADLLVRLRSLRVYAQMQILFYILTMGRRVARLVVPFGAELIASNAIMEVVVLANREKMAKVMHAPGMLLLRMIPGAAMCIGNIAILKAEPILYEVALRLCEHICHRLHARFLIPVYIRPGMRLMRWVYQLEWPA